MNILVPMLGSSSVFEENGYIFPKSLIEIGNEPMIAHVISNLSMISDASFIFVIDAKLNIKFKLSKVLNLIIPSSKVVISESETMGAACSALLAIDYISNDSPLIIANSDQLINIDLDSVVRSFQKKDYDAATIIFESVHPKWSSVKLDNNDFIIEASEKQPISKNATAGFYYYKTGLNFVNSAEQMIAKDSNYEGKYYICPTFNELILDSKKLGVFKIDRDNYINFSTPKDIDSYQIKLQEGKIL